MTKAPGLLAPPRPRRRRPAVPRLAAGAALLLAAQLVGDERGSPTLLGTPVRVEVEPVAAALAPLGPVNAVLTAALWTEMLASQRRGDSEQVSVLAEGLLALHPGLVAVREYLAQVLAIHEASRAPDEARRRALVMRGLSILEQGQAMGDDPRLHGALGRLLVSQSDSPDFRLVAREYFGQSPEHVAIAELRQAERPSYESLLLVQLLLRRASESQALSDLSMAERDLHEAADLLRQHRSLGHEVEPLILQLEQLRLEVSGKRPGPRRS